MKKVKKLLDKIPALIILYTYRVSPPKGKNNGSPKKGDTMKKTKTYQLTESGKAEVLSETCPICGADVDGNISTWDYVSNLWERIPLLCGHGFRLNENITDDANTDDWQTSVVIFKEYIQELEALGYTEKQD